MESSAEDAGADEATFILELSDMESSNEIHFEEIDTANIPDGDLGHLLEAVQLQELEKPKENSPLKQLTKCLKKKKTSRFKEVTEDDADKCQEESVALKTWKQTTWGVKIFRGKKTT